MGSSGGLSTSAVHPFVVALRNISLISLCLDAFKSAGFGVFFGFAHVFRPRRAPAGCSSGKVACSLCLDPGLRLDACPPGVPTIVCLGGGGRLNGTACVAAAAILRLIILFDVKN